MWNLRRFGMFLAFALASQPASAGFSQPLTIIGLDVGNLGSLYIRFAEPTQCGSYFVYIPQNVPYYESALSMALSAYSTGKRLSVWINDCQGENPAEAVRVILGSTFN
jgi:hypothetical protein